MMSFGGKSVRLGLWLVVMLTTTQIINCFAEESDSQSAKLRRVKSGWFDWLETATHRDSNSPEHLPEIIEGEDSGASDDGVTKKIISKRQSFNEYGDIECDEGEFSCDGRCLPSSNRCDGFQDCTSGIDEEDCAGIRLFTTKIPKRRTLVCSEFKCPNEEVCFREADKCNGLSDCSDGYDEQNCTCTALGVSTANTCGKYHIEPFFKANWYRANAYCHSIGMQLISIPTEQKQDEIVNTINKAGYYGHSFWTSGTGLGHDEYYWHSTGKTLQFKNWVSEPERGSIYYNNGDGHRSDCALLSNEHNFRWQNIDCMGTYNIICEKHE